MQADRLPMPTDSAVINLVVTATNLVPNKVYYNSAVATGSLGMGTTYLAISDSSNNGSAARMDLDNNGVSDDPGENVPTPFVFTPNLLPVQGLNLQAAKGDEGVQLTWNSATTDAFNGYEVERSVDGVNFEKIGTVQANIKTNTYTFSDRVGSVNAAGVYYNIKGLKADGTIAFSNTVYIKNNASVGLSAYPNPFHSNVSLQLQTEAKGIANIVVRDITGRVIANKNLNVEKGGNYLTVSELQAAPSGSYFVEVSFGSERASVKLMKQ